MLKPDPNPFKVNMFPKSKMTIIGLKNNHFVTISYTVVKKRAFYNLLFHLCVNDQLMINLSEQTPNEQLIKVN